MLFSPARHTIADQLPLDCKQKLFPIYQAPTLARQRIGLTNLALRLRFWHIYVDLRERQVLLPS